MMNLDVGLKKTRLILLEEFLVLLFCLGCPEQRRMFSDPVLLHNFFAIVVQLIKLKFCGAAKRAEIANIDLMKKIIPLITREISFGQHVCELMFGVNVHNLGVQINSVKQPIHSNSVGS